MPSDPIESDDFRTDEELSRAVRRGDGGAFTQLVRRHEALLRAYVFGDPMWAGDGDTLLRRVWFIAEKAIRQGRYRGGNFREWLFKLTDSTAPQRTVGSHGQRARVLAECFGRLRRRRPELYRLVFWVSHGLNRTAIARRYRVSKARLNSRYAQVMEAVRRCAERRYEAASGQSSEGAAG